MSKKHPRTTGLVTCTKCKEEKDAEEFYDGPKQNGLVSQCIACCRERGAAKKRYPRTTGLVTCSKCGEEKDATEFYDGSNLNGLRSECIICRREYNATRNFPRTTGLVTCPKCKEEQDAEEFYSRTREKNGLHPHCIDCCREGQVLRDYGITREVHLLMLAAQNYTCTCGEPLTITSDVDHCHETGEIRGILCRDCNRMLGGARDDPNTLRKAAEYLEAPRTWGYIPDST